jgi:hypothetical protein
VPKRKLVRTNEKEAKVFDVLDKLAEPRTT